MISCDRRTIRTRYSTLDASVRRPGEGMGRDGYVNEAVMSERKQRDHPNTTSMRNWS